MNLSVLQGKNENQFALGTVNLDFSLVRFDAPKEFGALGSSLSMRRRKTAEEGPSHQILRRLGVLFSQIVPSTPNLIRAYGLRASEIIQVPGINPKGTEADGPFRDFVGADGTSIWAAATSGAASIAVLLLACMLARKFDDAKVSVAIWAELVAERQKEILLAEMNSEVVVDSTMVAARQSISRDDLASFDASARSWISSADEAMAGNQKQLMLILKNIPLPVSVGTSTYIKVISAWTSAMKGLESLLQGMPQQTSDSAVLLALSAWHLYPNLLVLSNETQNVAFADPLFPDSAVITVGLQWSDDQGAQGIRWSLALSHLRYYGGPVDIDSRGDNTRVTMRQYLLVVFGALLSQWSVPSEQLSDTALWFDTIWKSVTSSHQLHTVDVKLQYYWLEVLAATASEVLRTHGDEHKDCRMLIDFGRRRGKHIFGDPSPVIGPRFFGLCNQLTLAALSCEPGVESGIQYFRALAGEVGLGPADAVIVYSHVIDGVGSTVLATAVPHNRCLSKRSGDGNRKREQVHARWALTRFATSETEKCTSKGMDMWAADVAALREKPSFLWQVLRQTNSPIAWASDKPNSILLLHSVPPLYDSTGAARDCLASGDGGLSCTCLQVPETPREEPVKFALLYGNRYRLALYVRMDLSISVTDIWGECEKQRHAWLTPSRALEAMSKKKIKPKQLVDFLTDITPIEDGSKYAFPPSKPRERSNNAAAAFGKVQYDQTTVVEVVTSLVCQKMPPPLFDALKALSVASQIYRQFDKATIPLKITSKSIGGAKWASKLVVQDSHQPSTSRPQTFACIAMFESGGLDIDPKVFERVFAISSGNSLFVAGGLLSDPAEPLASFQVKRIVGNTGFPGIALLVSPAQPMIKSLSDNYRAITHADYDHKRENNFRATSLHLNFTDWKINIPLTSGTYGLIDEDVHMHEAVVSVRDRGEWVADIDVLAALPCKTFFGICLAHSNWYPRVTDFTEAHISIDSWDELLDPPEKSGIIRAHGNWAARLAAVCILRQMDTNWDVVLIEEDVYCWKCVENAASHDALAKGLTIFVD